MNLRADGTTAATADQQHPFMVESHLVVFVKRWRAGDAPWHSLQFQASEQAFAEDNLPTTESSQTLA